MILILFAKNQDVKEMKNVPCPKHVLIESVKTLAYMKDADKMLSVQ